MQISHQKLAVTRRKLSRQENQMITKHLCRSFFTLINFFSSPRKNMLGKGLALQKSSKGRGRGRGRMETSCFSRRCPLFILPSLEAAEAVKKLLKPVGSQYFRPLFSTYFITSINWLRLVPFVMLFFYKFLNCPFIWFLLVNVYCLISFWCDQGRGWT